MSCKIIAQSVLSLTISVERGKRGVAGTRIINITVLPGHAHLQQLPLASLCLLLLSLQLRITQFVVEFFCENIFLLAAPEVAF